MPAGACSSPPHVRGRRYLVSLSQDDNGRWIDGPCFSGKDIASADAELRYLRAHFGRKCPPNVFGRVIAAQSYRDEDDPDAAIAAGRAKPLAGVRISTRRLASYTAATGPDGRYALRLPTGGSYDLHAAGHRDNIEIDLPKNACVERNIVIVTTR